MTTTLLTSGIKTATTDSEVTDQFIGSLWLVIDVTALSATPAVTPSLQIQDPVSQKFLTLWTAAAAITDVTGQGTYLYYFSGDNVGVSIYTFGSDVLEKVALRWGPLM